MSRQTNTHIKDYVIYDQNDDVIAIGNRPECKERLGWSERTAQNYLAVPPVGYTVVVFRKGNYECTRRGTADEKVKVFRVTNPCHHCKSRCANPNCHIACKKYAAYRVYCDERNANKVAEYAANYVLKSVRCTDER